MGKKGLLRRLGDEDIGRYNIEKGQRWYMEYNSLILKQKPSKHPINQYIYQPSFEPLSKRILKQQKQPFLAWSASLTPQSFFEQGQGSGCNNHKKSKPQGG